MSFTPEKPYHRHFWYPLKSSYKMFCSYWWKDYFTPRNYVRFVKYKMDLLSGKHTSYDVFEYGYANAYRQWEIFTQYKKNHCGHMAGICPACKSGDDYFEAPKNCTCEETFNEILDKIILAWESRLKILNDFEYRHEYEVNEQYNIDLYLKWRDPLDKAWKEGMALYIEYYDGFWD